jgi:TonB-linked SusC/RagA family outer membrane protein
MKNGKLKFLKSIFLLFTFIFCVYNLFAQEIVVTGTVTDGSTGESLPGVNILVQGTNLGTVTNVDGAFELKVPDGNATLLFSFVGFLTETIRLEGRTVLDINLVPDLQALEEVVVVGYGTMRRSDVTGAVSSIEKEDIAATKGPYTVQSLQGKAAGVDMVRDDGRAGSEYDILIRGASSLSGENDPLWIIDGVYGKIPINPNDIETIDILKDASATAIYGPRGANGVIIITTKKGMAGAPRVTFNAYGGITSPLGSIPAMDREAYIDYLVDVNWTQAWESDPEALRIDADTTWKFSARPWELYGYYKGTDYDWYDALLNNGYQQDYNLGFSGGTEKITYSASITHYNEQGMIKNDSYKRYGARVNLDAELTDFLSAGVNTILNHVVRPKMRNPFGRVRYMSPLLEPYDTLGQLIPRPKTPDEDFENPFIFEDKDYNYNEERKTSLFGTVYLEATFLKDLKFKTLFNTDIDFEREGEFIGVYPGLEGISDAMAEQKYIVQYVWQNLLSGNKTYGVHNIQFTLGNEVYENRQERYRLMGQDLALNSSQFYDLGGAAQNIRLRSDLIVKRRVAFLGRLHYGLMDKYLITATYRYDGASQLAEGNKWAGFPAVSVGWNMHNEDFMDYADFISRFKIRAGWGVTGNESVGPYSTLGLLTQNPLYYEFGLAEQPALGFRALNAPNPDLRWEKTKGWDIGLDFGLFANRIQGMVDLYKNKVTDLLQDVALAPSSGVLEQTDNVGSVENKGIEITLKTINVSTNNFKWTTDFTFYANDEKIVELSTGRERDELNGWFVGHPIQVFFDREKTGIWQIGDTIGLNDYRLYDADPGEIKVLDANGDTAITDADRVVVGTPRPKWTGGFKTKFTYKNIDLSVFVYARIGQTIGDGVRFWGIFENAREMPMDVDYWTPDNPTNDMPKLTSIPNRSGNPDASVLSYVDGSFVKIRDITLGYNFPPSVLNKIGLSGLRLYITAQNAFVFSKFFMDGSENKLKGNRWDPEQEGWDDTTSDPEGYRWTDTSVADRTAAHLNGGNIDIPTPKMYGAGINVTF